MHTYTCPQHTHAGNARSTRTRAQACTETRTHAHNDMHRFKFQSLVLGTDPEIELTWILFGYNKATGCWAQLDQRFQHPKSYIKTTWARDLLDPMMSVVVATIVVYGVLGVHGSRNRCCLTCYSSPCVCVVVALVGVVASVTFVTLATFVVLVEIVILFDTR